jgi:hypothetical protein
MTDPASSTRSYAVRRSTTASTACWALAATSVTSSTSHRWPTGRTPAPARASSWARSARHAVDPGTTAAASPSRSSAAKASPRAASTLASTASHRAPATEGADVGLAAVDRVRCAGGEEDADDGVAAATAAGASPSAGSGPASGREAQATPEAASTATARALPSATTR